MSSFRTAGRFPLFALTSRLGGLAPLLLRPARR